MAHEKAAYSVPPKSSVTTQVPLANGRTMSNRKESCSARILPPTWACGNHGDRLEDREKWMQLCAQAAIEQDSDRLLMLVQEINRLLEEKEQRLKAREKQKEPRKDPPERA